MKQQIQILVPAEIVTKIEEAATALVAKTVASLESSFAASIGPQPDLLFMRSILVSTGANKNDDVFLPEEMWNARSTPMLKPVDWEHNSGRELTLAEQEQNPGKVVVDNQTIGVMYNAYAIDENDVRIDEAKVTANDFEVPSKFHIVDEAVIWKALYPTTANRIQKGAEDGTLFVSMEAWFTDYNYVMGDKIIARNQETAFLDGSLRANGGTGVYGKSRVRRALRNITFGGKGIVSKPANDPSIITHVSHEPISAVASLNKAIASNIIGEIKNDRVQAYELGKEEEMSDKESTVPLKLLTEAKEENATLKAQASETEKVVASASKKVTELETQLGSVTAAFTEGAKLLDTQIPGFSSRISQGNPENFFSVLAEQLEEDKSAKADLETKLSEALAKIEEQVVASRTAAREIKIDVLLNASAAEGEKDKDKKAAFLEMIKKKKEKMTAAVKDMSDDAFDALYEVWASQLAESSEMNRGSLPVQGGSDMGRGAQKGPVAKASEGIDLDSLVKEVMARIATASKPDGADKALSSLREELAQKGHSVENVEAVLQAVAGRQDPTDEENLMALLENVTAGETPPAGAEVEGIDLVKSFGSLVNSMLNRDQEENK